LRGAAPVTIAIVTLGTFGDILPFATLGEHLQLSGHVVIVLSNTNHETFVRSRGLNFVGVSESEDPASGFDPDKFMIRDAIPAYKRITTVIADLMTRTPKLVIVNRSGNWGGLFASERYGLPLVSVVLQPSSVFENGHPVTSPVLSAVNRFRTSLGLAPLDSGGILEPACEVISMFPAWFGYPESRSSAAGSCVGFPFQNSSTNPLPRKIQDMVLRHGPPVVFSAGTNVVDTNFFDLADEFASITGFPVVAVGRGGGRKFLSKAQAYPFIDHGRLFPVARLIIHNGGIGVIAQAMRAAVPQIVIPSVWDQPDNARRVVDLGIGQVVSPDTASCKELIRASYAAAALERKSLFAIAAAVRRQSGVIEACRIINSRILQLFRITSKLTGTIGSS